MTFAELKAQLCQEIDEDSATPVYYSAAELASALNEGLQVFALLTLCLEATAPLTLRQAKCRYPIRAYLADYLIPLRITVNGVALRPARIDELDAESDAWDSTPGTPRRYVQKGFSWFAVTPQPSVPSVTAQITYARAARPLVNDADVPEIPDSDHDALVDYAYSYLRAKDGGEAIAQCSERLTRFIDVARKRGDYVRQKSLAGKYDQQPAELGRVDVSKLLQTLKTPKESKK